MFICVFYNLKGGGQPRVLRHPGLGQEADPAPADQQLPDGLERRLRGGGARQVQGRAHPRLPRDGELPGQVIS